MATHTINSLADRSAVLTGVKRALGQRHRFHGQLRLGERDYTLTSNIARRGDFWRCDIVLESEESIIDRSSWAVPVDLGADRQHQQRYWRSVVSEGTRQVATLLEVTQRWGQKRQGQPVTLQVTTTPDAEEAAAGGNSVLPRGVEDDDGSLTVVEQPQGLRAELLSSLKDQSQAPKEGATPSWWESQHLPLAFGGGALVGLALTGVVWFTLVPPTDPALGPAPAAFRPDLPAESVLQEAPPADPFQFGEAQTPASAVTAVEDTSGEPSNPPVEGGDVASTDPGETPPPAPEVPAASTPSPPLSVEELATAHSSEALVTPTAPFFTSSETLDREDEGGEADTADGP
ncbi:MAG: hypothetical protein ACFCBW_10810 [Candidatus Competibacterales bacterium]